MLSETRHNQCHLCTVHGVRDGTLLWGRKAHILRRNSRRLLRARVRWASKVRVHHGTRWHGVKFHQKSDHELFREKNMHQEIPEERLYPVRHEYPSAERYRTADIEEGEYVDLG